MAKSPIALINPLYQFFSMQKVPKNGDFRQKKMTKSAITI